MGQHQKALHSHRRLLAGERGTEDVFEDDQEPSSECQTPNHRDRKLWEQWQNKCWEKLKQGTCPTGEELRQRRKFRNKSEGETLHVHYCCSAAKLRLALCDPMDLSMPGSSVLHHLLVFAQNHLHWVHDAIQPSHPLPPPSPPAFNLSQHQDLFQWVGSSHQVVIVLECQLQHQSFQWIFRVDLF